MGKPRRLAVYDVLYMNYREGIERRSILASGLDRDAACEVARSEASFPICIKHRADPCVRTVFAHSGCRCALGERARHALRVNPRRIKPEPRKKARYILPSNTSLCPCTRQRKHNMMQA